MAEQDGVDRVGRAGQGAQGVGSGAGAGPGHREIGELLL
jgi:hypothetical protein